MIHPLVRKELREHLWVLIAMWVLCALGLFVLLMAARREGSPIVAYQRLIIWFGSLLSLALANRFVVREYGGRTQLFLETLPMGRAQVITVKWLTGAACLLVPMGLGFALVLHVATDSVELTSRFVQLMALRSCTFLLFIYALAFVIGLTGRYRYLLWLAILLGAVAVNNLGQVPFMQWPPLQLVSTSMAFERDAMPLQSLWITWVVTATLIGAAFVLTLGFQGSWVVALARRMSLREKIVVTAVIVSVVYVLTLVDQRKPKPPFGLQDAVTSSGTAPKVMVARAGGVSDRDAAGLAQRIAVELQGMREYLALGAMPAVAVLPDVSIDSDLFMVAELPDSDGVVVRGAFGAERFDEPGFRAFTLSRVLDWYSRGRATREQRRWLLDGFSRWRVAHDDPAQRELLALRAAVAAEMIEADGTSLAEALRHWLTTREQIGDCLSDAMAWRATELLATSLDEKHFRDLARALFGVRPHSDLRAFLTEESVDELLAHAGAPALAALAHDLQEAMRGERPLLAERIQAVRRWPVTFTAVPMRGSTFELRYAVTASGAEQPPPFAVRYTRIGPWKGEVMRASLERVDATTSGVLPASFARGERVFTAVEMRDPQLACTLRLGARRWELQ